MKKQNDGSSVMKIENNMLTFSDAEPIVEAKKVAVKYRYYISIIAMTSMLVRLEYDPDALYIQNGWWEIPLPPQYADNVAYELPPNRVTGIGFFEDFTDKLPSIVMDVEKQQVHILDERHIKEIKEKTGKSVISLIVTFDRAFGDSATWEVLVNEMIENSEV